MAEIMKGSNKKTRRLSINLSLFALTDQKSNALRSPKNFEEPNGVVGLGIVPLLRSTGGTSRAVILAISPRSSTSHSIPINIFNNNNNNNNNKRGPSLEEMELCEEYTCVISHVGSNQIKKIEYFNGEFVGNSCTTATASGANTGSGMGETAAFKTADFLTSCFLCKKQLHGLDIFMYRGETAFCSAECRCKQISMDEHRENCGHGVMKSLDYSVSPCSGPIKFLAGVAVA